MKNPLQPKAAKGLVFTILSWKDYFGRLNTLFGMYDSQDGFVSRTGKYKWADILVICAKNKNKIILTSVGPITTDS